MTQAMVPAVPRPAARLGRLVLLLLLGAVCLGPPRVRAAQAPAPELHVELEVLAGWARVARGDGTWRITAGELATLEAPFHLELGARSRARVRVPGELQLDLAGSTTLDLLPSAGRRRWTLHRLGTAELDLRRPLDSLHLPAGQVLVPARSLLRLEGRVDGRTWLEVRAGRGPELDLGGRYTFPLPVGFRRNLPARLTPGPATYRGR